LVRRLLSIAYFLEVGLLLLLVPWSTFWDRNYFADDAPVLMAVLQNNFVRGGVSGVGILNLCVGFADLGALVSRRRIAARSRHPAIVQADGPSSE
jgi:hypothetical protein